MTAGSAWDSERGEYDYETAFIFTGGEDDEVGDILVFGRCPACGRYLRRGSVLVNGLGHVRLEGWICSRDGEVKPFWEMAA